MQNGTKGSALEKGKREDRWLTRGLRRHRERLRRQRDRVGAQALVVGIDLARERQAVTFMFGDEVVGRGRLSCGPEQLDQVLEEAASSAAKLGTDRVVVAFEPAGHYWRLAAEAFERNQTPYVLVHPISVRRAREECRYTPEKTDPRDADLIAQLAVQGRFTDTQLPHTQDEDALWQLAHEYVKVRSLAAAEQTRLRNFWHRMLPEFFTVIRDPGGKTALAIACALAPLSELATLT